MTVFAAKLRQYDGICVKITAVWRKSTKYVGRKRNDKLKNDWSPSQTNAATAVVFKWKKKVISSSHFVRKVLFFSQLIRAKITDSSWICISRRIYEKWSEKSFSIIFEHWSKYELPWTNYWHFHVFAFCMWFPLQYSRYSHDLLFKHGKEPKTSKNT